MSSLESAAAEILALEQSPPGLALASGQRSVVRGTRHDALPMTLGTSHDLASITKIVATTTSIMRLIDAGRLSLDRRVRAVLPSSGVADDATIEDLLYHRAGLREWWPLYLAPVSPLEVLDALPLRYAPREARHYSDLGFMLLGRIVERVAGLDLAAAVQTLVLGPLGMAETGFAHPLGDEVAAASRGDAIERRMVDTGTPYSAPFTAQSFTGWRTHTLVGEVNDGNAFHAFGGVSGHAGLFSTVGDLLRFGTALATPDDPFLSAVVRERFFAPGPDAGQALGFRRYPGGVVGHPGFTGSSIGWIPGSGTATVLATNRLMVADEPLPVERMWALALTGAAGR